MTDDRASEEELMNELDRMYLRVADLENERVAPKDSSPYEHDQNRDHGRATHVKIIPFPARGIHVISGGPPKDEGKRKRRPWYRSHLMVSFSLIFLLFISLVLLGRVMMASWKSDRAETHPLTFPISLGRPSPAEDKDADRSIKKDEPKTDLQPDQTTTPAAGLSQMKRYTVQVGAFRDWQIAHEFMESLREKGLDAYWVETDAKDGAARYRVFSGEFNDSFEAIEFMRDKAILKDYPGSFVRHVPSDVGGRDLSAPVEEQD